MSILEKTFEVFFAIFAGQDPNLFVFTFTFAVLCAIIIFVIYLMN
jgi:hypothetical protein